MASKPLFITVTIKTKSLKREKITFFHIPGGSSYTSLEVTCGEKSEKI